MLRPLIVILILAWTSVANAGELTIATLNAELLTRPKVHVKFGLKFNIKQEPLFPVRIVRRSLRNDKVDAWGV